MPRTLRTSLAPAVVFAALFIACEGATSPVGTKGSLRVVTSTSGPEADDDGYAVQVDEEAPAPVPPNGEIIIGDLASGTRSVELRGIESNCSAGRNPRNVTISASDTTEISFAVTCVAKVGNILVSTSTTGANPDPDGYDIYLDGSVSQNIAANDAIRLRNLAPGPHSVGLRGIASNCTVSTGTPVTVNVIVGATANAAFYVVCS